MKKAVILRPLMLHYLHSNKGSVYNQCPVCWEKKKHQVFGAPNEFSRQASFSPPGFQSTENYSVCSQVCPRTEEQISAPLLVENSWKPSNHWSHHPSYSPKYSDLLNDQFGGRLGASNHPHLFGRWSPTYWMAISSCISICLDHHIHISRFL